MSVGLLGLLDDVAAIDTDRRVRVPLTAREREVVALIAAGLSNRQIDERPRAIGHRN